MLYLFLVVFLWVKLRVTGRIYVSILNLIVTETIETNTVTCLWSGLLPVHVAAHLFSLSLLCLRVCRSIRLVLLRLFFQE